MLQQHPVSSSFFFSLSTHPAPLTTGRFTGSGGLRSALQALFASTLRMSTRPACFHFGTRRKPTHYVPGIMDRKTFAR